mmetsp:Transcript_125096/g.186874  ORF Transcript_125096/g.186874 Transcript_125096/m.186874 type:complete len:207 (-) Transcript_125096:816-1436(-)
MKEHSLKPNKKRLQLNCAPDLKLTIVLMVQEATLKTPTKILMIQQILKKILPEAKRKVISQRKVHKMKMLKKNLPWNKNLLRSNSKILILKLKTLLKMKKILLWNQKKILWNALLLGLKKILLKLTKTLQFKFLVMMLLSWKTRVLKIMKTLKFKVKSLILKEPILLNQQKVMNLLLRKKKSLGLKMILHKKMKMNLFLILVKTEA